VGGNDEARDGVSLTNLDQPLFDGADATKRDLVNYLDAVRDWIIPELRDRPLSVMRVLRGQAPFMQKNVPTYTPPWVPTVSLWAEASRREVSYALCNDRRTLLWFANQRAVEFHPALVRTDRWEHPTHLVLDIDPPLAGAFPLAVRAAHLVRQILDDAGVLPGDLGGTRSRHTGRLHRAHSGTTARRQRSVGRTEARPATAGFRPGRGGAHDPHRRPRSPGRSWCRSWCRSRRWSVGGHLLEPLVGCVPGNSRTRGDPAPGSFGWSAWWAGAGSNRRPSAFQTQ
jgi:hypothetical protein